MGIAYLKDIRVIACTWGWAGSWAGSILADLGAEVIKVESKQKLDNNRANYKQGDPGVNSGEFNISNRGTKGITLNMRTPGGVKIFKELVKISDVIITNYTPQDYNWPLFILGFAISSIAVLSVYLRTKKKGR